MKKARKNDRRRASSNKKWGLGMYISVKSISERAGPGDGVRIMVDGTLPHGIDEFKAQIDFWPRSLAPSARTANIMHGGSGEWDEFKKAYFTELDENDLWVGIILDRAKEENVTLLYAYGEPERNNAAALKEYILLVDEKKRVAA